MRWRDVDDRAARDAGWPLHPPGALTKLLDDCLHREVWIEVKGEIDRDPTRQIETSLDWREKERDPVSGEVRLTVRPLRGDRIYWEVGSAATEKSRLLEDGELVTSEMRVSFVCVDSTGQHRTGPAREWRNTLTLRHGLSTASSGRQQITLESVPAGAEIRYTTDDSDPRNTGARYERPFEVEEGEKNIHAWATRDGVDSVIERFTVNGTSVRIDERSPARYRRKLIYESTRDSYEAIAEWQSIGARPIGPTICLVRDGQHLANLLVMRDAVSPEPLRNALDTLRTLFEGEADHDDARTGRSADESTSPIEVTLEADGLYFESGRTLTSWAEQHGIAIDPAEVTPQ